MVLQGLQQKVGIASDKKLCGGLGTSRKTSAEARQTSGKDILFYRLFDLSEPRCYRGSCVALYWIS